MKPSGSRHSVAPFILVGILVIVILGIIIVPQPVTAADPWADTCLDADQLEPGVYHGSFGKADRDVFLLDLSEGEIASIEIKFVDEAGSRMMVFGVNQLVMQQDYNGANGYLEVDESVYPKYFYRHDRDVSFTLDQGPVAQYRKEDAGSVLSARHLVRTHPLSVGEHRFQMEPLTDESTCLVMKHEDDIGGGSWILNYSVTASEELTKDQQIQTLRRTIAAQQDRINDLEDELNESETPPAGQEPDDQDDEHTQGTNSTQEADNQDHQDQRAQETVPADTNDGLLGMSIPLLWVIGLLAVGILLARRL